MVLVIQRFLMVDLKIDEFSTKSFEQLDFENSIERIQQDMAKALGVPYVLVKVW
jgi:hypothetical protein